MDSIGWLGWIPPSLWGEPHEGDHVHIYGFGRYGTDPTEECSGGLLHVGNSGEIRDWEGGVGQKFWVYRDGTSGSDAEGIDTGWRMGMGDSGGPVFSGAFAWPPWFQWRLLGVNSGMSNTASYHANLHYHRVWVESTISLMETAYDSGDGDGLFSLDDSCPTSPNVGTDRDGDGVDDACDRDRDLHFIVEPWDIKKLEHPLSLTKMTTGRARVKVRAVGGTEWSLSGSDMQVHWCDCDNRDKKPQAGLEGFHSGFGKSSLCESTLCPWNNVATIHSIDTPGDQPIGYYPATYSSVSTAYHPPAMIVLAPDDGGGPLPPQDLAGLQGTVVMTDQQLELSNGISNCDISPDGNPLYPTGADDFRHCQPARYRKYNLPTPSAPLGLEHVIDWHWREEPWWLEGPQPEKVDGFLWARAGWFGGSDEVDWDNSHQLHAGTRLTNTDTNGAPWSGGWSPFGFAPVKPPLMTTEIEFKPNQPLDLPVGSLPPNLRDLPLVAWIPWETAARADERIRYDETSVRPGVSASAGVAVVLAGGDASRIRPVLNVYPRPSEDVVNRSRREIPIDAERFAVTSARLDRRRSRLVDESALVVALFGGALADGTYDHRLFVASIATDDEDLVAHWQLVATADGSLHPDGRSDAALVFEPRHESLVLIGGENEDGVLGDIWLFDPLTREWLDDRFDVPAGFAVSRASQARHGSRVLLYGGIDADQSVTADLWAIDLRFGTVEPLDVPTGGPGPRASAAMVADENGTLWLFGGVDDSEVQRNDLWRLDLVEGAWTEIRDDCDGFGCPAGRSAALLLADDGRPMVVGGYTGQPSDIDARELRNGRWVGSDEVLGLVGTIRDCDGDGIAEPEYGRLCRGQQNWWAPVGKLVCDDDGDLVCNAQPVHVTKHRFHALLGGRALVPALERGLVFALGCGHVDAVRTVRGKKMKLLSRTWLGVQGHDLALAGDRLLVATDDGLREFDVSDPDSPLSLGASLSGLAAYEVDVFAGLVAVLDEEGLKLLSYNGAADEPPEVVGALDLIAFQTHEPWFGAGLALTKPGRLLLAGRVVFVSGAFGLFTVDVSDPAAPQLVSYTCAGPAPGSLGFSDGVVYGSGPWNPLVDFRDDLLTPVVEQGHDVRGWATGRALGAGVAVELGLLGLRMAEIEVAQ